MQGGMIANGVKVAYSTGSPITWKPIGQVTDITIPGLIPDKVGRTTHGPSIFKRNMPGMVEVSDMMVTVLADLDESTGVDQDALYDLLAARTTADWRAEISVDREQTQFTAFEFQGWVQRWEPVVGAPEAAQLLNLTVVFDGDSFTKFPAGVSEIE